MTELTVVVKESEWRRLKLLVLDAVSSPTTRRVYNLALDEFIEWYDKEGRCGFTKSTVNAWRSSLESRGLGSSSINGRLSAVRKLAHEAGDNGMLAPEIASAICRVRGSKTTGIRTGNWLSLQQAQTLLNAPGIATLKGLRDRAILAVLIGCALRRSEVAALALARIQQLDGRWCIVDLNGKHGRIRTVPIPTWVKVALDAWTSAGIVETGLVFRPINRGGKVWGERITEKVVWQLLQRYTAEVGLLGIAPHDLRRYAGYRTMPNVSQLWARSWGKQLALSVQRGIVRHGSTGLSRRPAGHRLAYNGQASCRWAQSWRGSLL